ncbi:flavodoxin [Spartinivicinus poritis]|uniref:Flavodoxin n=1 Tax=Spartinivicinus poritis TaxID=2994640 RepID=A0ABT5U2F8_9GAMM|nr:flavodoxin [Spartinivicinus sp. A2-2]MDE1460550.1 flavodoxin [Spartinivicinus sp. A2-2]
MLTIGLFYGSSLGNTEAVATKIQQGLAEVAEVVLHDIVESTPETFESYDFLIMGIPTWDFGELQSDYEDQWEMLEQVDFSGKIIALFGLGDQFGYADYFLDAMGALHQLVISQGGITVSEWPVSGYDFEASKALTEDGQHFVGLALDEDQQFELTDERIADWLELVKDDFGLQAADLATG